MWDTAIVRHNTSNGGNWNGKFDITNIEASDLMEMDAYIMGLPQEDFAKFAWLHHQIEYLVTRQWR